jgi:predicted AAA+ superfamily ATPase
MLYRGLYEEISGITAKYKLGYFRDYNQKETDFVVQKGKEIMLALECKLQSRRDISNLKTFQKFKPRESILAVEKPGIFEAMDKNSYAISIEFLAPCFE